jgi:hypothetical protein
MMQSNIVTLLYSVIYAANIANMLHAKLNTLLNIDHKHEWSYEGDFNNERTIAAEFSAICFARLMTEMSAGIS